jgi:hypothetical protein
MSLVSASAAAAGIEQVQITLSRILLDDGSAGGDLLCLMILMTALIRVFIVEEQGGI